MGIEIYNKNFEMIAGGVDVRLEFSPLHKDCLLVPHIIRVIIRFKFGFRIKI